MKIPLDRKLKLMLLHWLKDGSIDSEELKQVMGERLIAGEYDLTDFTDDELMELLRLINKARDAAREKERGIQ